LESSSTGRRAPGVHRTASIRAYDPLEAVGGVVLGDVMDIAHRRL
jgi:hypothetical protein